MRNPLPTLAGLALVIAMPILAPLVPLEGASATARILAGEAMFWLLAAALIAIVVVWEKRPLSSIGLHPPTWRSVRRGLGGLAVYLAIGIAMAVLLHVLADGVPQFAGVEATLKSLPVWAMVLLAIRAGVVEELMTRGFALHRLTEWTGYLWIGAVLQLLLFAGLHVPVWGWAKGAIVLVLGAVLTLLYLRHRDLAANMITHALVDSSILLIKLMPDD
ncbi:CPBP family intramembrane glutamic endopeptidase [Roseiterribacter gracilis]|uniref:Abortive infection protein n=1 Tax=Roseiterribacter gracilis TaxID=2812848 RepID=A0A8S8XGY7_9PROT|nr:abortive infection protein [Rhodospirillales bacterium TMPK1]